MGFATSTPEMLISAVASLDGAAGLAVEDVLTLHYPVMAMLTVVVFVLAYNRRAKVQLTRPIGGALLAVILIYQGFVVWKSLN